jgi:hypothetical protein
MVRLSVPIYDTYLHITSSCISLRQLSLYYVILHSLTTPTSILRHPLFSYDTYLHITSSCIPLQHLPLYYVILIPLRYLPPYYVILHSLTTPNSTLRHPVFPYDNYLHLVSKLRILETISTTLPLTPVVLL